MLGREPVRAAAENLNDAVREIRHWLSSKLKDCHPNDLHPGRQVRDAVNIGDWRFGALPGLARYSIRTTVDTVPGRNASTRARYFGE